MHQQNDMNLRKVWFILWGENGISKVEKSVLKPEMAKSQDFLCC
jgi:hypothetical protein